MREFESQSPMSRPESALRILLVEDHVATASALAKALLRHGFAVAVANTAEAAGNAARQQPFHLLITEIGLPHKNGWELFRELRRLQPSLMAIAVTGYADPRDVQRSTEVGFRMHLTKPVTFQQVLAAIRQLFPEVGSRAPLDEAFWATVPSPKPRPKPLRVLHLEDHEYDAELIQLACHRVDPECELTPVATREAFIRALQSGLFDGVLSDSSVHDLPGREGVKLARRLAPGRPYVFICGVMDPTKQAELVRANPDGMFSKDRPEDAGLAIELIRKMNEYRTASPGPG